MKSDIQRLVNEYDRRKREIDVKMLYSPFSPAYQFNMHQLERELVVLIKKQGIFEIENCKILEIGSGGGGVLLKFLALGASPLSLFGIDVLHDRLVGAHEKLPNTGMVCADGQFLPYGDNIFDLALQFTAFSSILDEKVKQNMAAETLRVLKPGGSVIWYDFWLNPTNPNTKGIRLNEIRGLFKGCEIHSKKITLAPPIARKVVPISWLLGYILEKIGIFNSHYLVVIKKTDSVT